MIHNNRKLFSKALTANYIYLNTFLKISSFAKLNVWSKLPSVDCILIVEALAGDTADRGMSNWHNPK